MESGSALLDTGSGSASYTGNLRLFENVLETMGNFRMVASFQCRLRSSAQAMFPLSVTAFFYSKYEAEPDSGLLSISEIVLFVKKPIVTKCSILDIDRASRNLWFEEITFKKPPDGRYYTFRKRCGTRETSKSTKLILTYKITIIV